VNLRNRLIAVFLLATLVPLGLTLWTTLRLLEQSLVRSPLPELDAISRSLETTGRELYQQARESLKRDAAEGRLRPLALSQDEAREFLEKDVDEQFELAGDRQNRLDYYVRRGKSVLVYSRPMGVAMEDLKDQIAASRRALEKSGGWNFKGVSRVLLVIAAGVWFGALALLVYLAARITRPVRQLTKGLRKVAAGDLATRLPAGGPDEVGAATNAFNQMAEALEHSRERLIQVTRLASWQALARKMAHEVKNSLTPIRLTMEEIASRKGEPDGVFLEQASQIVIDEVQTLERRVRAFSEFAAEPPVSPVEIDVNALVEERIALLRTCHSDVAYQLRLSADQPKASADLDLVKGVLTNLLENAAEAAGDAGIVLVRSGFAGSNLWIEVHDSGPGLSVQARSTLFEPSISFKKGGMGLGLSIARRSAVLCGGELQLVNGDLGGAAFRLTLAVVPEERRADVSAAVKERGVAAPVGPGGPTYQAPMIQRQ
jgi:two-component system, NtrC family, nitrogen regulation sensor histidine kinase NtrY